MKSLVNICLVAVAMLVTAMPGAAYCHYQVSFLQCGGPAFGSVEAKLCQ